MDVGFGAEQPISAAIGGGIAGIIGGIKNGRGSALGPDKGDGGGGQHGRLPRYNGPKPTYEPNQAHTPGKPGWGPRKTREPDDAKSVYKNAVPDDDVQAKHWYGKNSDGEIYRYSDSNNGTAHFTGRQYEGDGLPHISPYARTRLAELP